MLTDPEINTCFSFAPFLNYNNQSFRRPLYQSSITFVLRCKYIDQSVTIHRPVEPSGFKIYMGSKGTVILKTVKNKRKQNPQTLTNHKNTR